MDAIEKGIVSDAVTIGGLHCYMDQIGVPIPDIPDHMASISQRLALTYSSRYTSLDMQDII